MKPNTKLSLVASFIIATNTLANDTQDLGSITVSSANKSEQSIKDITSNVEVITKDELEAKHITTVAEALNQISGINYTSNGGIGSTTSLFLRGMNDNRTLILIDGIRYQDPSNTSGANIAHLMAQNIEKIEIIKGAQSGIWGADAVSGVINIITKSPKSGTHGSVNLEAGSFGTKKLGAAISHKTKEFDVQASGQKVESDGFTTYAPYGKDIEQYEDDAYENTTLNLKSNFYLNDNSKIGFNITTIDALKEYDTSGNANSTTLKSDIDTKLYALNYELNIDKHSLNVKYEKSDFSREEIGTTFGVKEFNGESDNVELRDDFKYNDSSILIMGVGASSDDVEYQTAANVSATKKNKDKYLYLTNSNRFDNTVFTQSLRHDNYDNFDSKTTGKLGVKHNYAKDIYVSSNVATAYNVPNIIQELNPWGATNTNINPENSKSAELTFGYKSLKTTIFYQSIEDLIEWYDPTPTNYFNNDAQYANKDGKSKFKGLELDYKNDIFKDTLFTLNYTVLSAKDEDGKFLQRRADKTLKFGLDYFGIQKLHLNLNGEYVGDRYERSGKSGDQTGRYTVANFAANYDVTSSIKTYLKIDNITDKYYQTVRGYATSPRAAYAGVKVSF